MVEGVGGVAVEEGVSQGTEVSCLIQEVGFAFWREEY